MPTYLHQCQNKECNNEWEDYYSITSNPPKVCPKCFKETAKRVICGITKGVVELTGHELVEKVKADAQSFKKEMYKKESTYANVLGEDKYQALQTRMDKAKRDRR